MKLKILSILLLVIGLGFQQASAQNVQSGHNLEEHNLLPNHNFADGFNHWLLYGATAEQDFNLVDSPNDNGQMVEYFTGEHLDPGGVDGDNIELVSRFIAAEGGVEYKVSAYFQAWDGPEGTIPSNMKIRFFSIGEEDNMSFLGEDFINFPGQTEDWQNLEITMVAPEGADSLDIVFDTFGSAGDVETEINLDAVYVVDTANLGDENGNGNGNDVVHYGDNVILNHNFANDFDHWELVGEEAEERFQLFPSDNDDGQTLTYEGGGLIQIFSEPVVAEPGLSYMFRVNTRTWGEHGGGANMKLIFMNEDLNEGEGDRVAEKWIFLPENTEEFVYSELTMVSPAEGAPVPDGVEAYGAEEYVADATHVQVEMATWHPDHEVEIDAVYVMHEVEEPTSVDEGEFADRPEQIRLEQNFPNPFNPTTQIQFSLNQSSYVTLDVYNVQGQHVKRLVSENRGEGVHQVQFDGSSLSSGLYLYRLQAGEFTEVRKMTLIK